MAPSNVKLDAFTVPRVLGYLRRLQPLTGGGETAFQCVVVKLATGWKGPQNDL